MTEDLIMFMLTSVTGIAKEKRKNGTDIETVTERTKCLLNTTGIESLCGELSEIQSRSFVVNFDIGNQGNDCFIEFGGDCRHSAESESDYSRLRMTGA